MSFIHTAELNGVAPFDYLVAVLRNPDQATAMPAAWLPWTFLKSPASGPDPPWSTAAPARQAPLPEKTQTNAILVFWVAIALPLWL